MSNEKLKRKDFFKSITGARKNNNEVLLDDGSGDPVEIVTITLYGILGEKLYYNQINPGGQTVYKF